MMRTQPMTVVENMLQAAICASRCRRAAATTADCETRESLNRAADRYSGHVAELADELLRQGRPL